MPSPPSNDEKTFQPHGIKLAADMLAYIDMLTQKAASVISFRTGSGRIFTDLLIHWPLIEHREEKARELCQRITDGVYPLIGDLYAQGADITATISPHPIQALSHVNDIMACVIFDSEKKTERVFFITPERPLPSSAMLSAQKGIVVVCRPLHPYYHTITDDREHKAHPHIGMFEMAQRLINELYALPPFIARESDLVALLKTKIDELPKKLETAEVADKMTAPAHAPEKQPSLVIPTINSLAALPSAVQALERLLMTYVSDASVSEDLRFKLRQIVQILIAVYPRALIDEAARNETSRQNKIRPLPKDFPKATPTPDVGKLSKVVRQKLGRNSRSGGPSFEPES